METLDLTFNADPSQAAITSIGWDTENTGREHTNLLRLDSSIMLVFIIGGKRIASSELQSTCRKIDDGVIYQINLPADGLVEWKFNRLPDGFDISVHRSGPADDSLSNIEIVFPFNPRVTAATVIPSDITGDEQFVLPVIINAPDYGQILLKSRPEKRLISRLEGNYTHRTVDFTIELGALNKNETISLRASSMRLPAPKGIDTDIWKRVRRGWFGAIETLSKPLPGDERLNEGSSLAPAGLLGNEVISGIATCSMWYYADHTFWIPEASGISIAALLRKSIDWCLATRWIPGHGLTGYFGQPDMVDSNPSLLISAWDYVESTGDIRWLKTRITDLEKVADFLEASDTDGDGMIESKRSGNKGTLIDPMRGSTWWDTINSGYKDGYLNALTYRAWRTLADLERKLARRDKAEKYEKLASSLKHVYRDTLYNPSTGWLGWWRSQDGELHDYASPMINGLAIEYGLVDKSEGRKILARLRHKIEETGYTRFDLGVPATLLPIRREDYILPPLNGAGLTAGMFGIPSRDDGADALGRYQNGGVHAGNTLPFLTAHYVVGDPEPADRILLAMLSRQDKGLFQNGVWGQAGKGTEWTTWDGNPSGADGYLADNYRFLQAVFMRNKANRARFHKPMR